MKYLLLLFLIWTSLSYSPQPVPTCNPPSVTLKDVPITLHETQLYNVNDFFTGFNLQYNLSSSAPAFAFFRKKFSLEKTTAISQPGLKSYHL